MPPKRKFLGSLDENNRVVGFVLAKPNFHESGALSFALYRVTVDSRRRGMFVSFLRLTDSELVALELDCGWMTLAGLDPVTDLTHYPNRYRLLHIKDFKKGFMPTGISPI